MASGSAARRYARALFTLADEQGEADSVRRELQTVSELLQEHPELRGALFQPLHPARERKAALVGLAERLGSSILLTSFLQFLIDQRRLIDFETICAEYGRLADAAAGRMGAQVRTASPLSPVQREQLESALSRRSGRRVDLSVTVDESLLGGVVAQLGDLVFDGSLRTQLRQLRASLTRED